MLCFCCMCFDFLGLCNVLYLILLNIFFSMYRVMPLIDSETQEPDDENHPQLDSDWDVAPTLAPECNTYKWKVQVIGKV